MAVKAKKTAPTRGAASRTRRPAPPAGIELGEAYGDAMKYLVVVSNVVHPGGCFAQRFAGGSFLGHCRRTGDVVIVSAAGQILGRMAAAAFLAAFDEAPPEQK